LAAITRLGEGEMERVQRRCCWDFLIDIRFLNASFRWETAPPTILSPHNVGFDSRTSNAKRPHKYVFQFAARKSHGSSGSSFIKNAKLNAACHTYIAIHITHLTTAPPI